MLLFLTLAQHNWPEKAWPGGWREQSRRAGFLKGELWFRRASPAPKRLFLQNHRVEERSRARALMPWRQMCVNKQGTQPPPENWYWIWKSFFFYQKKTIWEEIWYVEISYLSRNHRSIANVLIDDERIIQREMAVLIDWWYLCGEENAHSRDKKRAECPRIHPAHSHRLGQIIAVFDSFLQDHHHVNRAKFHEMNFEATFLSNIFNMSSI